MDQHAHHGPQTRADRKAAERGNPGLWPLWIVLGAVAALFGAMWADGHGGAVAAFVLMIIMCALWVGAAVVAIAAIVYLFRLKLHWMLLFLLMGAAMVFLNLLLVMPALKATAGQ
ncbi:MAG TPA: hypothetical protein VFZ62_03725 [Candidatus Saccharimonadales bacterium]